MENADVQRWRKNHHQQLQFRLLISSDRLLPAQSTHQVKAYILRTGGYTFADRAYMPLRNRQAGTSSEEDSYKTDASLSDQGRLYAEKMGQALLEHREGERLALVDRGGADIPLKPLKVWTSTRRRTVETADWLYDQGYSVRQRTQLSALNPGVCEKMSEKRIRAELPDEVAKHEADPYHHRYPRAEVRECQWSSHV